MNLRDREILESIGMDYEDVKMRMLGNEDLMMSFIRAFAKDDSYSKLLKSVTDRDEAGYFVNAHTFKGLVSNFSFRGLYQAAYEQTEAFRRKDYEEGIRLMAEVTSEYEKVIKGIEQLG